MYAKQMVARYFWNEKFQELNESNKKMIDISDTMEGFVDRLDQIAIENEVSSFGFEQRESFNGSVRATMEMKLGEGKHYQIDIAAEGQPDKKVKVTYVEISLIHENNKEFLTNIFFQRIPYAQITEMLQSLKSIDDECEKYLLEFRKKEKLEQMNITVIKSLLKEKFKDTKFEWELSGIDNFEKPGYVVRVLKDQTEVSRLMLNNDDFISKIQAWDLGKIH